MPSPKTLAAAFALGCAAITAQAAVIDINWGGDGRFEARAEMAPGKFVEVCGKLAARLRVQWSFEATGLVDFNIHYHQGKDVIYPAEQSQVARGQAELVTELEQDYCWMWTNKSPAAVALNVRLAR